MTYQAPLQQVGRILQARVWGLTDSNREVRGLSRILGSRVLVFVVVGCSSVSRFKGFGFGEFRVSGLTVWDV